MDLYHVEEEHARGKVVITVWLLIDGGLGREWEKRKIKRKATSKAKEAGLFKLARKETAPDRRTGKVP